MSYQRREEETVYTIDQLRLEIEENQLGIGITDEDGPLNTLIAVLLRFREDFLEWARICKLHPQTVEPSSYPAIAVWYTRTCRGAMHLDQSYMLLPLHDIPCTDSTRPYKKASQ